MVKRTIDYLLGLPGRAAMAVAFAVVSAAALAWRARATLLEAAGAVALAVFAAGHVDRGAWLVAAVACITKAAEVDARARRSASTPGRSGRGITHPNAAP